MATVIRFTNREVFNQLEAVLLRIADEAQNAAIGAALKATADRDAAFKSLDNWMKVYERIAKSALKKRPDLAKKINIAVK